MYESPINRIIGEISTELIRRDEEHLMAAIKQEVGYQVNKEELFKALKYDRQQYEQGYNDALKECSAALDDILTEEMKNKIFKRRFENL